MKGSGSEITGEEKREEGREGFKGYIILHGKNWEKGRKKSNGDDKDEKDPELIR